MSSFFVENALCNRLHLFRCVYFTIVVAKNLPFYFYIYLAETILLVFYCGRMDFLRCGSSGRERSCYLNQKIGESISRQKCTRLWMENCLIFIDFPAPLIIGHVRKLADAQTERPCPKLCSENTTKICESFPSTVGCPSA